MTTIVNIREIKHVQGVLHNFNIPVVILYESRFGCVLMYFVVSTKARVELTQCRQYPAGHLIAYWLTAAVRLEF